MAVGITVACIPTIRPVIFPQRYRSSSEGPLRYSKGTQSGVKSMTADRTRLQSHLNDSFGRSSEGDDIELELSSGKDASEPTYYAHVDTGNQPTSFINGTDDIEVRRDMDITWKQARH